MSAVFIVWGGLLRRYLSSGPICTFSSNMPIVGATVMPYNLRLIKTARYNLRLLRMFHVSPSFVSTLLKHPIATGPTCRQAPETLWYSCSLRSWALSSRPRVSCPSRLATWRGTVSWATCGSGPRRSWRRLCTSAGRSTERSVAHPPTYYWWFPRPPLPRSRPSPRRILVTAIRLWKRISNYIQWRYHEWVRLLRDIEYSTRDSEFNCDKSQRNRQELVAPTIFRRRQTLREVQRIDGLLERGGQMSQRFIPLCTIR